MTPDLRRIREILEEDFHTEQTVKDASLQSLKEMLRNKMLQEGGGVYYIHDLDGRVVFCEEILPDGTLRPVPEERWYDFMDE